MQHFRVAHRLGDQGDAFRWALSLAVKPGITGWAQVNGRTELPWDERIELDLWYIEHRSWRLDLQILWRTARMVLGGEGLYRGETPAWRDPPPED